MAGLKDAVLFGLVHDYFKVYLPNQRKCSPHTIRSYRKALDALFEYVKKVNCVNLCDITFKMIDSKTLSDFLDSLENGGCSVATRNLRLNCIRAFYSYAAQMEATAVIYQTEILKVPIKQTADSDLIDHMSEAAIKALLSQPSPLTKKGLRDQVLMLLMYDTAARVQEMLDIKICDIKWGKTPTVVLHGKGSKMRTVPLMENTAEHLKNYLTVFHPNETEFSKLFLFYTISRRQSNPMHDSTVRKLLQNYGKLAKEKCLEIPDNVHPHLLRHSRAMHLYQHGMDLTLVSQWLGHAQLDTTLIYAYADTEKKREAIKNATLSDSPLKKKFNSKRFSVTDEETLKKLYGLR